MNAHSSLAMPSARAATPSGPSPSVSGIAGIPIAGDPRWLIADLRACLCTTAAYLELAAQDCPEMAEVYRTQIRRARALAESAM